jgi:hypothetical protein
MEKAQVTLTLPAATYKLAQALTSLAMTGYEVTKDGFQPGSDLPVLWKEVSLKVLPVFPLVKHVPAELQAAPVEAVAAAVVGCYTAYKA